MNTNALPLAVFMLGAVFCPPAGADPIPPARAPQVLDAPRINAPIDPYCYDQRLCDGDFGSTYYCPDTGGWVGPFGACDALVTGPYAPGGLRPNEGLDR